MTEYLNSVSIPVIVTVVYVIIDLIKTTIAPYAQASERLSHFYPLIALALGIATAAVMYYVVPESITQTNLLVALAVGAASGLTAVGTNQVVKQLAKVSTASGNTTTQGNTDTSQATAPASDTGTTDSGAAEEIGKTVDGSNANG